MKINVVENVLKANDVIAESNRDAFRAAGTLALNLMSSPGSGKTTLLEKTLTALRPDYRSVVFVGDLQTTRDAERLEPFAEKVVQINTGLSCHLYANQVGESIKDTALPGIDFVFIENVGNMVCPGEFDLGENLKVALLSVPEGDDKVAKYPTIFRAADVVLLTKVDLLSVLDYDLGRVTADLRKINDSVPLIQISPRFRTGLDRWLAWLKDNHQVAIGAQARCVTEV